MVECRDECNCLPTQIIEKNVVTYFVYVALFFVFLRSATSKHFHNKT